MLYIVFFVLSLCGVCQGDDTFEYIFQPGPLVPATQGQIWPQVQHQDTLDDGYFSITPTKFSFSNIGQTCNTLQEALTRYQRIIAHNSRLIKTAYYTPSTCNDISNSSFLGFLTKIEVELRGDCKDSDYPFLGMNEEYVLNITSSIRRLSSESLWGILRGLETFSQLIYLTDDLSCHRVETISIHDYPRFPYRGFLLDTSRHYQTPNNILRLLDAMAYNKFNVFHWHLTDDYSFPYVSTTFPELSEKGSYNPRLWIYTPEFVQTVLDYARTRGIRVIPEFDTPGHTLSWGLGNPTLLTQCIDVPSLNYGPINPTLDSTYTFIFALYDEIRRVFNDQYVHLGGDEVDFSCWESNPNITNWMTQNGIDDFVALQSYYTKKLIDYVTGLNRSSIVYEEVYTNGVTIPTDTVVSVWILDTAASTLSNVTADGHPAIVSAYWYLDQLATGGDWVKFYNADPQDFPGTDEQRQLVIGGETAMWSEVVDDNNLESRVWPRACAAAEKFWSAKSDYLTTLGEMFIVAARLQEQACRLNRRGIHAEPPSGPSICY